MARKRVARNNPALRPYTGTNPGSLVEMRPDFAIGRSGLLLIADDDGRVNQATPERSAHPTYRPKLSLNVMIRSAAPSNAGPASCPDRAATTSALSARPAFG